VRSREGRLIGEWVSRGEGRRGKVNGWYWDGKTLEEGARY